VDAAFTRDSATQITATVPAGAAAYPTVRWRVHWPGGGEALHPTPFTVTTPTLTGMAPAAGPVGSTVTLTGTNLVGASSVSLNFVSATFSVDSPTQITATVPSGVPFSSGRWRVTTPSGTAPLDQVFYVGAAPSVWGVSPQTGTPGDAVTITGTDFQNATSVSLGGVAASFSILSPTQITATVPVLPTNSYTWQVTTPLGTAASPVAYTVVGSAMATYTDPAGDGDPLAPDITNVTVANHSNGLLTFDIDLFTDPTLEPGTAVWVSFDTDRNPSTGAEGDERMIVISPGMFSIRYYGWDGLSWIALPAQTLGVSWFYGPTISINRSEFPSADFGFWIGTARQGTPSHYDFAPELGWWYFRPGYGASSVEATPRERTTPRSVPPPVAELVRG
jgi:hypothetical protein